MENFHVIKQNKDIYTFEGYLEITNKLKSGTIYELHNNGRDCFLREGSGFTYPDKLYDVDMDFRAQVVKTVQSTKGNIGVLLEGYKGQGKTICAKKLCDEIGLPVINITSRIPSNIDFVRYINSYPQDLVILIDEFEKNFPKYYNDESNNPIHSQESFLSFMDGSISSSHRKIFILTTNDPVDDKLMNRPSRIRYFKKYEFMDRKIFDMILEDKLKNKEFEKDLRENLPMTDATIDLLNTIIDEINLHNKPYSEFKEFFNHRPKMVKYERFELIDDTWKFLDTIESPLEIGRDTKYLPITQEAINVINMSQEYIFFTVTDYRAKRVRSGFNSKSKDQDTEEEEYTRTFKIRKCSNIMNPLVL